MSHSVSRRHSQQRRHCVSQRVTSSWPAVEALCLIAFNVVIASSGDTVSHSVSRRHGQHFSLYVCVCVSCYGMALKQQPAVSSVWHDLGVCYYHVMKVVEGHQVKLMAGNCVISLKQALRLEPTNHCHWNALGVAAAHPGSLFFFLLAGLREAHHACQFYIYSVIQKWDFCPTWVTLLR